MISVEGFNSLTTFNRTLHFGQSITFHPGAYIIVRNSKGAVIATANSLTLLNEDSLFEFNWFNKSEPMFYDLNHNNDTRTNLMKKIAIDVQTEQFLIENANEAVEEEAKTTVNGKLFYILCVFLFLVLVICVCNQQKYGRTNIIHLNTTRENVTSV